MPRSTHQNNAVTKWLIMATVDEARELAATVGTSLPYLRQLAYGERRASAEMAGAIERATSNMHERTEGRLPRLTRSDLCPACAGCPYAPKNNA